MSPTARPQIVSDVGPHLARASMPARPAIAHDTGVIPHAEHIADLILAQGATSSNLFRPIQSIVYEWFSYFRRGLFPPSNEKIDGSPSIVMGFTPRNIPFVAYKGGFTRKNTQILLTSSASVVRAYDRDNPLRRVFQECQRTLRGHLLELLKGDREKWKDVIVQGDLLFTDGDHRRIVTPDSVDIRANEVLYSIPRTSPLYESARDARIGVVAHSIARRHVEEGSGRLTAIAAHDDSLLRELTERLASDKLFIVDPLRDSISLGQESGAFKMLCKTASQSLIEIDQLLASVTHCDAFRREWRGEVLEKTRRYLNSQVKYGSGGGIFKAARNGEPFEAGRFIKGMTEWISVRAHDELRRSKVVATCPKEFSRFQDRFNLFIHTHLDTFSKLLRAYYLVNSLQQTMHAYAGAAMRSKLGGGPIEGLVIRSGAHVVKWVDRLGFTMSNNLRHRTGTRPAPFDRWNPGTFFFPGKFQPPHSGHIELLKKAVTEASGAPVFVIVSPLQPRLHARTWSGMKVAPSRRAFEEFEFIHVFSRSLRDQMFRAALPKTAQLYFVSPDQLWGHIEDARVEDREGKVKLLIGQKEIEQGRYKSQFAEYEQWLEPLSIELQGGGISGTEVRQRVRAAALHPSDDTRRAVSEALSYIPKDRTRERIARKMITEYRRVIEKAKLILEHEKRAAEKRKMKRSRPVGRRSKLRTDESDKALRRAIP